MFAALNSFQVGGSSTFVSDVFSTSLYTGNGSSQTITNGINLSTKGGLAWVKSRSSAEYNHLVDTVRGGSNALYSNATSEQVPSSTYITAFNETGFTLGSSTGMNGSGMSLVSWTFRKQRKFFDIVTYTGNGTSQSINHNLGSVPGCIMVKQYATNPTQWAVYHRSLGSNGALCLNDTSAFSSGDYWFNAVDPTSTTFTVGGSAETNQSGKSYIAYIFAHNDGGFGTSGIDNVISCGSYTGSSGSGQSINLGYKPQWLLVKNTSRAGQNWILMDKFRNFDGTGYGWLYPNSSVIEQTGTGTVYVYPTSTGFTTVTSNGATDYLTDSYIYMAIKDNS